MMNLVFNIPKRSLSPSSKFMLLLIESQDNAMYLVLLYIIPGKITKIVIIRSFALSQSH
jgi:hypothetical protein